MTSFELSKRSPLTTAYIYIFICRVKDENEELPEESQISVNPSDTPIIPSIASDDIDDFKRNVAFTVKLSSSIIVTASLQFIKTFFQKQKIYFPSKLRAYGKLRENAIPQWHRYYSLQLSNITSGTYTLFYHKPVIFCSILDFSYIYLFL